ncbi:MAG: hypothetical protein HZA36_02765, partial [Parcubacteria group bacterium]|nr:hypothetical protein [Parcubacteria group bacterium]
DNTAVPSYLTKPLNLIPWTRDIGNSVTALMTQHRDFAILNVNWNQMYFFPWFTLPFTQLFSYTDIPYPLLRETYHGLLLSEYFDYTVYEAYKSYQAPDDAYLVIKPPQMPESRGREIRVFRFVQGLDGWKYLDLLKVIRETGIVWNQTAGNENLGSLELSGSKVDFNFTRAVSPFITASPGNVYTVMGYAKTGEVRDANEKDGFFRIDFYPDARDELLRGSSLRVAVSDALFGSDSWTKEEIITTAPPGTRYLAISFQRSNPKVSSRYWLDDIRIFESNQPLKDRFPQIPYLHPTMPDNILYPNSIY